MSDLSIYNITSNGESAAWLPEEFPSSGDALCPLYDDPTSQSMAMQADSPSQHHSEYLAAEPSSLSSVEDGFAVHNMETSSHSELEPCHEPFSSFPSDPVPYQVSTLSSSAPPSAARRLFPYPSPQQPSYAPSLNCDEQPPQPPPQADSYPSQPITHASHASMDEVFALMAQPAYLQSYMDFLKAQHAGVPLHSIPGAMPPSQPSSTVPRSRSNSQPSIMPTNTSNSFMTQPTIPESDECQAQNRERKLMKYRAKRTRRMTLQPGKSIASNSTCDQSLQNNYHEMSEFAPVPKIQKTHALDLENRLMSSEEECMALRYALDARDAELLALRMAVEDQQQYIAMLTETTSNASSSACTSPRPRSPSTPAMVSSPSSMSVASSMETDLTSPYSTPTLETASMSSDFSENSVEQMRLAEKLKKLGGPPSDVYYPWWNGVNMNHPAFQQKEDWANVELRPQDLLARERLNYLLNQQKWKLEQQNRSASSSSSSEQDSMIGGIPDHNSVPMHHDDDGQSQSSPSLSSHPYTHQSNAFYQSPHQSHVQTGSPVNQGFWSGHFVPSQGEKIDFSKISLRKTGEPEPLHQPSQPPRNHQGQRIHHHPLGSYSSSPTAAIWREAMSHPEFFKSPQFAWLAEQHELQYKLQQQQQQQQQQTQPRAPFRRHINSPSSAVHSVSSHGFPPSRLSTSQGTSSTMLSKSSMMNNSINTNNRLTSSATINSSRSLMATSKPVSMSPKPMSMSPKPASMSSPKPSMVPVATPGAASSSMRTFAVPKTPQPGQYR